MRWNVELPQAEWYDRTSPGLQGLINAVRAAPIVAIDTETTGLTVWKDMPLFWSLSFDDRRIAMPADTLGLFREAFAQEDKIWVFANAKFDLHILANYGIVVSGRIADTQVMHALLYEEQPHGLKDMAKQLLGWKWLDFTDTFRVNKGGKLEMDEDDDGSEYSEEDVAKGAFKKVQDAIMWCYYNDREKLTEYAANDAFGTWKVFQHLKKELESAQAFSLYNSAFQLPGRPNRLNLKIDTQWDYFEQMEMPFTRVLFVCERNGALVDFEYLRALSATMMGEADQLQRRLNQLVGRAVNVNSGDQLRSLFIDEMGLKPLKKTKGGKKGIKLACVDKDFYEFYENHEAVAITAKIKKLKKLTSTYVDKMPVYADSYGRIHTRFNQDVARTGRLSSSEPNCFHPNTELLTPAGWVEISKLQQGTPVAQWDNGVISFVQPTAYQVQYAAELVHLHNEHTRLAVTRDHRCLLRHRKTGQLRVFTGEDYPEDWQQIHAGMYAGGELKLPNAFIGVLLAVQADGHYNGGGVDFSFKKERKALRLRQHLDDLQATYSSSIDANKRYRIRILKQPLVDLLRNYLGSAKELGAWLLELHEENLIFFCEEISFWDGCWTRKTNYSSDSKNNATWVQTILSLRGRRAHLRPYVKQNGENNWQVDHVDYDYSLTTNIDKSVQPYDGEVYCVSVPSSYVVVRFEDQVCITGQCQNIPNAEKDVFKIRKAFISPPGYDVICKDYDQLEMRLLGCASLEASMIETFKSGKDIHMSNAELIYGLPYDDIKKAKKLSSDDLKKLEQTDAKKVEYYRHCVWARGAVKTVGFGLNYGMKEKLLANKIKTTIENAVEVRERYLAKLPAVNEFYEEAIAECRATGYSYTICGRRRFLPEIASQSDSDRWRAERQAVNNQIQGTAADAAKLAMINCYNAHLDYEYGCRMLLQVHDELVFEAPKEVSAMASAEIEDHMTDPFPSILAVTLSASGGVGPNWCDAKEGH